MRSSSVGTLRRPAPRATPPVTFSGVIEIGEMKLLSSCRVMRHRCKKLQSAVIEALARDFITNKSYKGMRHLVRLSRDAFERGAPTDDLKAVSREYDAMIDGWLAERDGWNLLSLADAQLAEEKAQATKEVRETEFRNDPSPANATALLGAIEVHRMADNQLARIARAALNGARIQ